MEVSTPTIHEEEYQSSGDYQDTGQGKCRPGKRRNPNNHRKVKREKSSDELSGKELEKARKYTQNQGSRRRSSGLSNEVEKIAQGGKLSPFQAMAMLRKALVTSIITPTQPNIRQDETSDSSGVSNPGPASGSASAGNNTPATQKKNGDADSKKKVENSETSSKLESKSGKKSESWRLLEKNVITERDPNKVDPWKAILISDLFPKGVAMKELIGSSDEDSDIDNCEGEIEDIEEESEEN